MDNRSDEIPPNMESRCFRIGHNAHPPLGITQPELVDEDDKYLYQNEWYNHHKPTFLEKLRILIHGNIEIKKLRKRYSRTSNLNAYSSYTGVTK